MCDDQRKSLAPKVRFPEFRNEPEWDEITLGSVLTEHGERTDEVSDVHSVSVRKGVVNQVEHLGRSFAAADRSNYKLAKPHDIIYTKSPTGDFPYGIVKQNRNPYNVIVSPLYGVFSPPNRYLGYILDVYFESPIRTNNYLAPIAQKGAKNTIQISNATFLSNRLYLPSIEAEQRALADCLMSLDEAIAAQERKVDALKAHKKGLIQQLFPRAGETLPRRRLQEFKHDRNWRIEKTSSLLSRVSNPVGVDPEGTYREIGIRSHGKGIFHKDSITGKTIGNKRVFRMVKDAFVVNIVFAWEQAVATTSESEEGMIASHRFPMFVTKPGKCDVRYVKDFFLTKRGKHLLELASPGGAGRNRTLGQKEFEKLEIALPGTVAEQARIADCLSSADDLIVAETEKLHALNTHKQGLMQQLFPLPDGIEG